MEPSRMTNSLTTEPELSAPDDLVWGAKGIAKAINRTERQARHLIETA